MLPATPMFKRYQPRPLSFLGVESIAGYLLKTYLIRSTDQVFDAKRFAERADLAAGVLPQPPSTSERPGVGFAVLHQIDRGDYLVVNWWDRQNELPTRVFVRGEEGWRPSEQSESFCVWDLRVIWWEREAYVGTVLAGSPNAMGSYLASVIEGFA